MTQFTEDSLWLSFQLDGANYCVLSDYVESIQIPGSIEAIPGSAARLAGVTRYDGALISVIELRTVFGRMNLADYTAQFGVMKDMHIAWVEDLERFVRQGGEFNKPVNPHKCKFGLWYDGFHTENFSLNHILKKLASPHERIHECGAEIKALMALDGDYRAQVGLLLEEARELCHNKIVPMLDELITIYRDVNRGILLVVNDGVNRAGLLVDEVTTLTACHKTRLEEFPARIGGGNYLRELVINGNDIQMSINVECILGTQSAEPAPIAAVAKSVEVPQEAKQDGLVFAETPATAAQESDNERSTDVVKIITPRGGRRVSVPRTAAMHDKAPRPIIETFVSEWLSHNCWTNGEHECSYCNQSRNMEAYQLA